MWARAGRGCAPSWPGAPPPGAGAPRSGRVRATTWPGGLAAGAPTSADDPQLVGLAARARPLGAASVGCAVGCLRNGYRDHQRLGWSFPRAVAVDAREALYSRATPEMCSGAEVRLGAWRGPFPFQEKNRWSNRWSAMMLDRMGLSLPVPMIGDVIFPAGVMRRLRQSSLRGDAGGAGRYCAPARPPRRGDKPAGRGVGAAARRGVAEACNGYGSVIVLSEP